MIMFVAFYDPIGWERRDRFRAGRKRRESKIPPVAGDEFIIITNRFPEHHPDEPRSTFVYTKDAIGSEDEAAFDELLESSFDFKA